MDTDALRLLVSQAAQMAQNQQVPQAPPAPTGFSGALGPDVLMSPDFRMYCYKVRDALGGFSFGPPHLEHASSFRLFHAPVAMGTTGQHVHSTSKFCSFCPGPPLLAILVTSHVIFFMQPWREGNTSLPSEAQLHARGVPGHQDGRC